MDGKRLGLVLLLVEVTIGISSGNLRVLNDAFVIAVLLDDDDGVEVTVEVDVKGTLIPVCPSVDWVVGGFVVN